MKTVIGILLQLLTMIIPFQPLPMTKSSSEFLTEMILQR